MKLYKYSKYSEHLLGCLVKRTIWLSKPSKFNDIFDCQFRKDNLKDSEIDELKAINLHRQSIGDKLVLGCIKEGASRLDRRQVIEDEYESISSFMSNFGLISLSEVSDSLLMWAHYAGNHSGVCIEYEVDENQLFSLKPVNYSTEYPKLKIYDFGVDLVNATIKILTTKSMEWVYEKEWRYFENAKGDSEVPSPFRISGIIFGARMKEDQIKTVKAILTDASIKHYKSIQSSERFALEISEVAH